MHDPDSKNDEGHYKKTDCEQHFKISCFVAWMGGALVSWQGFAVLASAVSPGPRTKPGGEPGNAKGQQSKQQRYKSSHRNLLE